MPTPRLLSVLLAIGFACLLPACASHQTSPQFTALRVSNQRGEMLAEYVARGPVWSVEGGYRIHAIERRSPPPFPQFNKYPYGWDTTVLGPRIHTWPVGKPYWLMDWEAENGAIDDDGGLAK